MFSIVGFLGFLSEGNILANVINNLTLFLLIALLFSLFGLLTYTNVTSLQGAMKGHASVMAECQRRFESDDGSDWFYSAWKRGHQIPYTPLSILMTWMKGDSIAQISRLSIAIPVFVFTALPAAFYLDSQNAFSVSNPEGLLQLICFIGSSLISVLIFFDVIRAQGSTVAFNKG
tara:strand:+ start:612 stop:1133 length:522 start_codon:yes stop_codon:yes gene_type:complete